MSDNVAIKASLEETVAKQTVSVSASTEEDNARPKSDSPDLASVKSHSEEKKTAREQDPKKPIDVESIKELFVERQKDTAKAGTGGIGRDVTREQENSRFDTSFVESNGTNIEQIKDAKVGEVGTSYHAENITIINNRPSSNAEKKSADKTDPANDQQAAAPWPSSAFVACRDNIDDIAFLMGAAALEGRAIGAVRFAAADLAKRLAQEIKLPADAPPPVPHLHSVDTLFEKFRLHTVREKDEESGSISECVHFGAPTDGADILVHGWTRLSGFPNWLDHLTHWLRDLGASDRQEIRVAAGRAAGLLWISGAAQVEREMTEPWYADENILPLDALDACYVTAAQGSPILQERIRSELWAWGNITYGIDDIFALRHLSTRRYRIVDPDACFEGLEALLGKNNLLGLIHVQEAYERLFVTAMDEPKYSNMIAASLLRVLTKAKAKNDATLRTQAIAIALSLIEADRRSKGQRYFVLDRVLQKSSDTAELARLINTISAGSAIQAPVIRGLRAVFMRGLDGCVAADWTASPILSLFEQMYALGAGQERERLLYHLDDWIVAAAEKSSAAGVVGRALLQHMLQRIQ